MLARLLIDPHVREVLKEPLLAERAPQETKAPESGLPLAGDERLHSIMLAIFLFRPW